MEPSPWLLITHPSKFILDVRQHIVNAFIMQTWWCAQNGEVACSGSFHHQTGHLECVRKDEPTPVFIGKYQFIEQVVQTAYSECYKNCGRGTWTQITSVEKATTRWLVELLGKGWLLAGHTELEAIAKFGSNIHLSWR